MTDELQPPKKGFLMFGATKSELSTALSQLSDSVCGYTMEVRKTPAIHGHVVCDCKYGFNGWESESSEQTGCPEMEQAAQMVLAMTSAEFERICRRAGIMVVDK